MKFGKNRTTTLTAGLGAAACLSGSLLMGVSSASADAGNDFAVAAKSFPAKADINGRKHKGDAADAPGSKVNAYEEGQQVPVKCQSTANGQIWDETTDGWWVPDAYVKTGSDGYAPGVSRCEGGDAVHGRSDGPAGPKTGTRQEKIARVLKAAKSQVGKGYEYAWGSGGKGGPSYGVHHYPDGDPSNGDDYNRFGFDCSGLTLYAYWRGAGIDIGEWTGKQYESGKRVSLEELQPGDLVFWGDGDDAGSTTHVVMYVGDGKVVEAAPPRDGKSVHVRNLYGQGGWTAHAIRVIN